MISKQRQNTTADLSTKSWELQNCLRGAFDTSRPYSSLVCPRSLLYNSCAISHIAATTYRLRL